jgi:hypothetical protein
MLCSATANFYSIYTPTIPTPVILHTYPPMEMEQTECSKFLAYELHHTRESPRRKHTIFLCLSVCLQGVVLNYGQGQLYHFACR